MKFFNFFKFDKNKLSIVLYVVLTVILSYLAIKFLSVSNDVLNYVSGLISKIYEWITPGILGVIIAYLMYPLVDLIFKKISKIKFINDNIAKYISITLAYLAIVVAILGFFYIIYVSIGGQLSNNTNLEQIVHFISNFANSDNSVQNASNVKELLHNNGINVSYEVAKYIADFISAFKTTIYSFISSFGNTLINLSESIFSMFIGVILSIYFIKDAEYFLTIGRRFSYILLGESKFAGRLKIIFSVFNITFKRYIKGQILEALCVSILSMILLLIFNIKFALLIAIVSGLTNMIPYVGPITGTILAGVMGLLDGNVNAAIIGIILMIIVQQIDNNILAPKIVGGMVGLHPVFIIIGLIIGGKFYGVFGMVLAVPVIATIKLLFNIWFHSTGKNDEWTLFKHKREIEEKKITEEIDNEFEANNTEKEHANIINNILKKFQKTNSDNNQNNDKNNNNN